MTITKLPTMRINKFQNVLDLPKVDSFTKQTFDNRVVELSIHQGDGPKYFIIHSIFQVYGWTTEFQIAFQVWGNVGIYTTSELYEGLRGREVTQ